MEELLPQNKVWGLKTWEEKKTTLGQKHNTRRYENRYKCLVEYIKSRRQSVHTLHYITLTPLAGSCIQSDLQWFQGVHFASEYMPYSSSMFSH